MLHTGPRHQETDELSCTVKSGYINNMKINTESATAVQQCQQHCRCMRPTCVRLTWVCTTLYVHGMHCMPLSASTVGKHSRQARQRLQKPFVKLCQAGHSSDSIHRQSYAAAACSLQEAAAKQQPRLAVPGSNKSVCPSTHCSLYGLQDHACSASTNTVQHWQLQTSQCKPLTSTTREHRRCELGDPCPG
jgi:hypothetical protein